VSFDVLASDPAAASELGRACGIGPALGQVLLHRGLGDPDAAQRFLDPRLSSLTPPEAMADRGAAVDRLARAVRRRERVAVFGDYDVDGTTATAVLTEVIEALGGEAVPLLANRFDGGYGLSRPALERCLATGARLLVTCDCGSSDHERIAEANRRGVEVIVIDHHLVPAEPLPALAFLNPHRPECGFPFLGLASVGLALVVAAGLRAALGARLDLRRWLDLVALGTIADVAPLEEDNRALVRSGLRVLRSTDPRPGLAALRALAVRRPSQLGARDVAFGLAPRLNAPGRLGDPMASLRLLRARSHGEARALAAELERANQARREVERRLTTEALAQVPLPTPSGVVVWGTDWHPGVLGIVAARLVDAHGVPALVLGVDGKTGQARGSGRAPAGRDLHGLLRACRGVLDTFGGHAAACGLELAARRLPELRDAFASASGDDPTHRDEAGGPSGGPVADVALDPSQFPVPKAQELDRLEPLGAANPDPVFLLPAAEVTAAREVGAGGAHLALELRLGGGSLRAFWPSFRQPGTGVGAGVPFRGDAAGDAEAGLLVGARLDLVGHLSADGYRGGDQVELRVRNIDRAAVGAFGA
jgi:single-stranded-DNA-specific exonuclease